MKIKDVFFKDGFLCVTTEDGQILQQPLEWYPHLLKASDAPLPIRLYAVSDD